MNASEAYEKYKHLEASMDVIGNKLVSDLWSAVKHEHFGSLHDKNKNMDYSVLFKPVEEVCGWDWPIMLRTADDVDAEALDSLLYLDRTLEALKKGMKEGRK